MLLRTGYRPVNDYSRIEYIEELGRHPKELREEFASLRIFVVCSKVLIWLLSNHWLGSSGSSRRETASEYIAAESRAFAESGNPHWITRGSSYQKPC